MMFVLDALKKRILSESSHYTKITPRNFDTLRTGQSQATVLVCGTSWSGPTAMMHSIAQKLSCLFTPEVEFFQVDLEKDIEVATFFGIHQVPTTVLLKNGKVKVSMNGLVSAKKLSQKITEELLSDD